MARKRKRVDNLSVIEPNAAGADVGATQVFVAVPGDRDPEPVRCFATFTADLEALAKWLERCGIRTLAMESTGVYWLPLFQILEARGIKVCLVNARHVKNVPGRKSDVADCQWLQFLHSVGLLRGSFRPDQGICAIRSLWRHRDSLIQMVSVHLQHMQKALDQTNLQIHHVISDLAETTGLAIVDAILAGERDPKKLAGLRDWRIRATEETIMKSLVGDYRDEHLFTLRQSLVAYRHYQQLIAEVDGKIKQLLCALPTQVNPAERPLPAARNPRKSPWRNEPTGLREDLYRAFGVDLTQVPGIDSLTAQRLLTEIGPDLSAFPNGGEFASWLRLCPNKRVTAGKVLSSRTGPTKNRAAVALRMAAQALHPSQTFLGEYYRRMRARLGAPKAITAAAHKLARIVYHLLTTRQPYDESIFVQEEIRFRQRKERRLRAQAHELGFQLVPVQAVH